MANEAKTPRKAKTVSEGRRVSYSKEAAEEICNWIAKGRPWSEISGGHEQPDHAALHRWSRAYPRFAEKLRWAREVAADDCADRALAVAEASTPATVTVDRLKISMLQWYATRQTARGGGRSEPVRDKEARGAEAADLDIHIREFVPVTREDGTVFTREIRPDGSVIDGEA